jgi:exonuclease III
MSHIIQRCRWCHIIVLNVHAPTEDKTDDVKDSFYEKLERLFDKLTKYHMKILLGNFNAEVDGKDIFKLTIGNESLDFATSKNLRDKSMMFSHSNIHNILGHLQMGKPTIRLTIF